MDSGHPLDRGGVVRAVVDDDHLGGRIGLPDGAQARVELVGPVVDRHHDRDVARPERSGTETRPWDQHPLVDHPAGERDLARPLDVGAAAEPVEQRTPLLGEAEEPQGRTTEGDAPVVETTQVGRRLEPHVRSSSHRRRRARCR